jgi:hypothetical protein
MHEDFLWGNHLEMGDNIKIDFREYVMMGGGYDWLRLCPMTAFGISSIKNSWSTTRESYSVFCVS